MPHDQMAVDHARDMADLNRMRETAHTLRSLTAQPPRNTSPATRLALDTAVEGLEADMARIVRKWD